jgi:putative nucleotidyltransferase with HDIG domain
MRSRGERDSVVDYPTPSQAIEALSKAGCSPQVIEHCKIVSQLAVRLARLAEQKGIEVDINLVRVGGLLHDIGRSRTHGVEHDSWALRLLIPMVTLQP